MNFTELQASREAFGRTNAWLGTPSLHVPGTHSPIVSVVSIKARMERGNLKNVELIRNLSIKSNNC